MKNITPLTWVTTVISSVLAFYLVLTAENHCIGFVLAIGAGTIIGLINMGIHELWYKHKKRIECREPQTKETS